MSAFANLSTSQKAQWIISIAVPLSMLLLPGEPKIKIFFAVALWGILTIAFGNMPVLVPSLGMPAMFVLFGLAPAGVVYAPWATPVISLTAGSLIMANCLSECGLLNRWAYILLQRCGGKFTTVCWATFAVSTVLSIVTFGNISFVMAAMVYGLIKSLGVEKKKEGAILMMGSMSACLSSMYYMYAPTSVPIVAAAAAPVLGEVISITWLDFFTANWPVIFFTIIVQFVVMKVYGAGKSAVNMDPDYFKNRLAELGPVQRNEKWGAILLFALIAYIILSPVHKLDTSYGFILFGVFALMPGISIASEESLKKVNWPLFFFIAACLAIGAVSTVLGINESFVGIATKIGEKVGSGGTLGLIMVGGTLANLLLTPITILTAFGAPMTQLAVTFGLHPTTAMFTLIFTEWLIVLPYESMPTMVWFAFGAVTMQDFFKTNLIRVLIFFVFFFVAILPWWNFVGMMG